MRTCVALERQASLPTIAGSNTAFDAAREHGPKRLTSVDVLPMAGPHWGMNPQSDFGPHKPSQQLSNTECLGWGTWIPSHFAIRPILLWAAMVTSACREGEWTCPVDLCQSGSRIGLRNF